MAEATARRRDFSWGSDEHRGAQSSNERRKRFFDRNQLCFVLLGLVGNALFFFGSVAFLFKSLETPAIYLFIAGLCFMLVSSTAASISEYSHSEAVSSSK